MSDADREYVSTPEGAEYEHTDIEPAIASRFAVWLAVAMIVSGGIVYGTFWLFEGRSTASDARWQQFPLAAGQPKEPPPPRLQTQPFKDVYLLKQGQAERLETFGWIDRDNGFVHIPIERAMELTREMHVPARPDGKAAPTTVVQDSSSGRTAGVR